MLLVFFFLSVYPCPLVSVRFRESIFKEAGHTIMNLLAVSATLALHFVLPHIIFLC